MGMVSIAFDGITAYTVNHLDTIPVIVNNILHACFLCGLDAMVFLIFMYILDITRGIPESGKVMAWILLPFVVNIAVVIIFIPELNYKMCIRDRQVVHWLCRHQEFYHPHMPTVNQ